HRRIGLAFGVGVPARAALQVTHRIFRVALVQVFEGLAVVGADRQVAEAADAGGIAEAQAGGLQPAPRYVHLRRVDPGHLAGRVAFELRQRGQAEGRGRVLQAGAAAVFGQHHAVGVLPDDLVLDVPAVVVEADRHALDRCPDHAGTPDIGVDGVELDAAGG